MKTAIEAIVIKPVKWCFSLAPAPPVLALPFLSDRSMACKRNKPFPIPSCFCPWCFITAVETLRHLYHSNCHQWTGLPFFWSLPALVTFVFQYTVVLACIFLLLSNVECLLSLCVDHLIICLLRSDCLHLSHIFYRVDFFFCY